MKTKKLLSVFITLAMLMSLLPMSVSVSAEETDNKYVKRSWDGRKVTQELCDIPTATALAYDKHNWRDGWYVAEGEIEISSVEVDGDVNLVLKDGCKLNITGSLDVFNGYSLTIYAQKGGTGTLTVANGIGAGSRTSSGDITIHGGNVTVTGTTSRPAIGCGNQASMGTFTLYGGNVTATGAGSAAIGQYGTASSGAVNIYGGKLTAAADEGTQAIKAASVTIGEKVEVTDGSGNLVTLNGTWAQTLTGSTYTFYAPPVVDYQYYDKTENKFFTGECDTYTVVTKDTTEWTTGWYVVNDTVEIPKRVAVSGRVNLILTDGCELTATYGIKLETNNILTIYAQSGGTGRLNAKGLGNAGIGSDNVYDKTKTYSINGGTVMIHGGVVNAEGSGGAGIGGGYAVNYGGGGGTLEVYGGTVYAKSNFGAGIGGGRGEGDRGGSGGSVKIYGGSVTAESRNGAGIGGGYGGVNATGEIESNNVSGGSGYKVYIYGGSVTAKSIDGAGIGGGCGAERGGGGGTVNITGGIVKAESERGAGIGGGCGDLRGGGGTVNITGGVVTAKSVNGAGIGSGYGKEWGTTGECADVTLGDNMAACGEDGNRVTVSEGQSLGDVLNEIAYVKVAAPVPYRYYDIDAGEFKDGYCFDCEVIDEDQTMYVWGKSGTDKWYVVKGKVSITGRPEVTGDVHLILTDDCVLTVEDGINVYTGNSLSIYGHENGTGVLIAGNEKLKNAGIGGGLDTGKVEIHGGEVSAKSEFGAGIGGGEEGNGGTVYIYGGVVNAESNDGAGIGGGYGERIGGKGGTVKITGGVVTAKSVDGAGIGGGGKKSIGEPATVTLGDNMVVSEGGVGNSYHSVKIVEKEPELDSITVPGAQIRLSGSQGLRFVGEISESVIKSHDDESGSMLDNKNFSEDYGYGFIVLPKDILGDNELTFDTENIAVVPANNVYEVGADYVRFTVCIIDILPKNYKREYTVRPYIRYTQNGETKTLYGEQYATSVYSVADAAYKALGDEKTPQAILDILGLVRYTVHYVDEDGNDLSEPQIFYYFVGGVVAANATYVSGYQPVELSITIQLEESENHIWFVYKPILYKYTVYYVLDGTDIVIADPYVGHGKLGERVSASSKNIDGYRITGKSSDRITLCEDERKNVITFTYELDYNS